MKSDSEIPWKARLLAGGLRLVPLASGCGRIASRPGLASLAGSAGPVWVTTRWGSEIRCYLNDYVGRALFYFGDLDPKVSWVFRKVLRPGDRVIDVGANVGLLTLLASQLVGAEGKVLAIEPQPRVLDCLGQALERNGATNVVVGPYGVGERPGTLVLHVPGGNLGGASFRNIPDQEVEALEVEVKTLAEAVREHHCEGARLVKLDVEGFECQVIRGVEALWRKAPPEVVVFEFRESGLAAESPAGELLAGLGYHFYRLPRRWFVPRLLRDGEVPSGVRVSHDVVAVHENAPYDALSFFNN